MTKDLIVQSVIKQLNDRSEVGIKKYGTTLHENNTDDFLQHLKEELMDAILYIEKLQKIKENENNTNKLDKNLCNNYCSTFINCNTAKL